MEGDARKMASIFRHSFGAALISCLITCPHCKTFKVIHYGAQLIVNSPSIEKAQTLENRKNIIFPFLMDAQTHPLKAQ